MSCRPLVFKVKILLRDFYLILFDFLFFYLILEVNFNFLNEGYMTP